jgi:thiol-disulfide isomerase/thioredoxin
MSSINNLRQLSSSFAFKVFPSDTAMRGGRFLVLILLVLGIAACNIAIENPTKKTTSQRAHPVNRQGKGAVWDESTVRWEDYTQGMDRALRENKPVLLVIETDWCGYCKAYSWTFLLPEVAALADEMVMIRVNADNQPGAARLHAPNGRGVPRTFLFPAGGFLALPRGSHPNALRLDYDYADPLIHAMRAEVETEPASASGLSALAKNMAEKAGVTAPQEGTREAAASTNPRVLCIVDGKPIPMFKSECKSDTWVLIQ